MILVGVDCRYLQLYLDPYFAILDVHFLERRQCIFLEIPAEWICRFLLVFVLFLISSKDDDECEKRQQI